MAGERTTENGSCGIDSVARIYESGDELVVLLRIDEGLLELRVPQRAVAEPTRPQHEFHINADAAAC